MKNGVIVDKQGSKRYYENDQLHRLDGPAVEGADGIHDWYFYGKYKGTSISNNDGTFNHYINGNAIPLEKFKSILMSNELNETLPENQVIKKKNKI